ncbi:MAG: hypothetical protein UU80_C0005G0011 [candidate division WWE3 bacterium GW2011_GWA1_41_8]|nr:MAG: hypothetical protein UU72_C0020G0003 [candidate division WWE3 bacterium GW2011_GWB1_41_6]KKS22566.1 MAG: hypothetical protein UU80_C0005G0011 [candidate division WWE3 bacterium GW2011_GWA1_41_8]
MHILNTAWNLPDDMFNELTYDEMTYASEILDFEYGLYDANNEDYPKWVEKYFEWKQRGVTG